MINASLLEIFTFMSKIKKTVNELLVLIRLPLETGKLKFAVAKRKILRKQEVTTLNNKTIKLYSLFFHSH